MPAVHRVVVGPEDRAVDRTFETLLPRQQAKHVSGHKLLLDVAVLRHRVIAEQRRRDAVDTGDVGQHRLPQLHELVRFVAVGVDGLELRLLGQDRSRPALLRAAVDLAPLIAESGLSLGRDVFLRFDHAVGAGRVVPE